MGNKLLWEHMGFDLTDKEIDVFGPKGFRLQVDYDDVDHAYVEKTLEKMIRVLNKHWNDKA